MISTTLRCEEELGAVDCGEAEKCHVQNDILKHHIQQGCMAIVAEVRHDWPHPGSFARKKDRRRISKLRTAMVGQPQTSHRRDVVQNRT